ncbi:hypothetical protein F3J23_00830 [Chryseobacterium sp. Tr-659]|uniref:hypothetical protein n=1 Tax=Chryseobacterium sp. Tr-659 TaxID=2608340 RepID=UPI00141F4D94|nr:hypothetical protein [Chryseobacterium sp. Tr-659]NIF03969.1 hypothetical protein [Chryseobacterium sp. Tr-659]
MKAERFKKFIFETNEIHGNFYNYKLSNYVNVDTKIKIICPKHGEFERTPYKHIKRRQGCSKCGIEKARNKRLKPFKKFIEQAKKTHRNQYDYSLSETDYDGAFTKIKIICKKHGVFKQTPNNHVNNYKGCYHCDLNKLSEYFSRTQEEFISLAKKIHGELYDYSKSIYNGADEKITIVCFIHGEWEQTAQSHLKGHKCPKCTGNVPMTKEEFTVKAINTHGEIYNYAKVNYKNAHTKVKIDCKSHDYFLQTPSDHIYSNRKGCPKCTETIGERKIRLLLESLNIEYEFQKKFNDCVYIKKLIFDFYLPKLNLAIEYDGVQHFHPIETFGGKKSFQQQLEKTL